MPDSPYNAPESLLGTGSIVPKEHIRTLQIITFALIQGIVVFAVIAFFINGAPLEMKAAGNPPNAAAPADEPDMMLVYIFSGIAAVQIAAHFLVPPLIQNNQLSAIDRDAFNSMTQERQATRLMEAYRAPHIVACAIAEGAAFLGLVGYFIIPSVILAGIALFAVVLIAVRFPTSSKLNFWVEDQIRSISTGF